MVFFNYSTMQMTAKIVYYGPGLCGKTTNLKSIYSRTSGDSRGEMVSLETETDRTLFFDLLPIDVGSVSGFQTKLQLYTVPGQVFYNTTRKLVLKGVDGVVFVADSQRPMRQANIDSLGNLEENLEEMGLSLDEIPLVLQYNKRDLPDVLSIDELQADLNRQEWPYFSAAALEGDGVFETLKEISKITLMRLKDRLARSSSGKSSAPKKTVKPAPVAAPRPVAAPAAAASPAPTPAAAPAATATATESPAPVTEPATPKPSPPPAASPTAVPSTPVRPAPAADKPRRQVDALAELEKLRQTTLGGVARATTAAPANGGGEISRNIRMALTPTDLERVCRVLFSLQLHDSSDEVVESLRDFRVELEGGGRDQVVLKFTVALNAKG